MLVTGSANAINQVVEKDTDAQMKRTAKRPVAAGRMSVQEGWAFAVISGAAGVFILGYFFNWLTAGLAAFSLFLYAFIYTPLKKINSIAVLAGAIPGAMPCLIGWAAGNNNLAFGGWILFAFQFFWQFPSFLGDCLGGTQGLFVSGIQAAAIRRRTDEVHGRCRRSHIRYC
jgi:protoheme IX farnesyltransferase